MPEFRHSPIYYLTQILYLLVITSLHCPQCPQSSRNNSHHYFQDLFQNRLLHKCNRLIFNSSFLISKTLSFKLYPSGFSTIPPSGDDEPPPSVGSSSLMRSTSLRLSPSERVLPLAVIRISLLARKQTRKPVMSFAVNASAVSAPLLRAAR